MRFLLVCAFLLSGCGPEPAPPVQSPDTSTLNKYQAEQIWKVYDANELDGDAKLKDRWCIVCGTAKDIGVDLLGTPYITLESESMVFAIQCFFSDEHKARLAQVKPGSTLHIKGRCDGKMGNVAFGDCVIVASGR